MNISEKIFYKNGRMYKSDGKYIYIWIPGATPGLGELGGFFKKFKKILKKVAKPVIKLARPFLPFVPVVGTALTVASIAVPMLTKRKSASGEPAQSAQPLTDVVPVPLDNSILESMARQANQRSYSSPPLQPAAAGSGLGLAALALGAILIL